MCLHETVQLTDEHRTILCADCGREFGHLARDERETFYAYITPEHPVVLLSGPDADMGVALGTGLVGTPLIDGPVYPCAKCGWAAACDEEDGGCHT